MTPIVDCDVHPTIADVSSLRKYMSKRAARRAFGLGLNPIARDPNRIPHPTSGQRLDSLPPAGGPAGSDPAFALEQWIEPHGISSAVLIPVQAGTVNQWGDEETGAEFLSAMNEFLLAEWTQLDRRYRVVVSVSPYDVPSALREIERLADIDGVCGIFFPHGGVALGRSHYFPVYELAESLGLPIVLHPTGAEGNMADAPRLAGGLPDTYPERHSLLLMPGQAVLASMIFARVFDRFRMLRVVLSEYGFTWVPPLTWRMDRAWEQGDRILAGLERPPSAYVRENVRFTSQPLDEPEGRRQLELFLEWGDADRTLMFSSDYPHWDTDDPKLILNRRLPQSLRSRVAYENALECFGPRLGL